MWICNFHAVDFDENEVVHFFSKDGAIQLCDDFSHCRCLASTRSSRDVDTSTGALHDCRTEMIVDRIELCLATRQGLWHCRYMQQVASLPIW